MLSAVLGQIPEDRRILRFQIPPLSQLLIEFFADKIIDIYEIVMNVEKRSCTLGKSGLYRVVQENIWLGCVNFPLC